MADIDYTYIDSEHLLTSFDDVVSTVEWIKNAMKFVFVDKNKLSYRCTISFDAGELSYECHSLDEFKQYAFGKDIKVKVLRMFVTEDWVTPLIAVYAHNIKFDEKQKYILSSKDEKMLVDLRTALKEKRNINSTNIATQVVMCEKYEDSSIHIGNNNQISNSVIGSKNTVDIEEKNIVSENKEESLISKTFWQFFVPIAVGVIVVAIVVWLGLQ